VQLVGEQQQRRDLPSGALGSWSPSKSSLPSTRSGDRSSTEDAAARGRRGGTSPARVEQVGITAVSDSSDRRSSSPAVCELLGPVRDERRPVGADEADERGADRGSRQVSAGRYTAASEVVAIPNRAARCGPARAQRPSSATRVLAPATAGQQGGRFVRAVHAPHVDVEARDHGRRFLGPGFAERVEDPRQQ